MPLSLPVLGRLLPCLLLSASLSSGYTVLTHQAIVDAVWDDSLKPALHKRFPSATPEELRIAHSYAYGGCIIQDLGYYPFSSRFFSDLTHYVRSGDFVAALIHNASTVEEYAFALGALEHFIADADGHRIATNLAVPLLYPDLRKKYGQSVTYWDSPTAHLRTEFGFDVVQVARGRYSPDSYREFIGFRVSRELLERTFQEIYGIAMKDIFSSVGLAIGSYRYSVSSIIPKMTRVAWRLKHEKLVKEMPGITRKKFLYNLSRSSYEKEWGKEYRTPGRRAACVAFFIGLIPKVGPFRALDIPTPTPIVERMFMASFNSTVEHVKPLIASSGSPAFQLPNQNIDASLAVKAGRYRGADEAFARLLAVHAKNDFKDLSPELRRHLLAYYAGLNAPATDKGTLAHDLQLLRAE